MADTYTKEKKKASSDKYRQTEKYALTYIKSHLKCSYGISYEDYLGMYQAQGEVCKICGIKEFRRAFSNQRAQFLPLFVDHCHVTGKVRGLLCSKCNTGLGMFGDDPNRLTNAISYLKENQT